VSNDLSNIEKLVGVGLRHPHFSYVLENKPGVGWFEVHSENFFQKGGASPAFLKEIRDNYPLSLHGVGLSLGSAEGLSLTHLEKIKQLIDRYSPFLVSEHISWSTVNGVYLPDLLPVPYTAETLDILTRNIDQAQTALGCEVLIENPSSYMEYKTSTYTEVDFLKTLCKRTGTKLLLDINNIFVSASNHGWDASSYIKAIPSNIVGEIHLAGHGMTTFDDGSQLRVDTHGSHVCDEVWDLFSQAVGQGIRVPTLIEWDADLPDFEILHNEAKKAEAYL
jgi:uncharacterized protein (UPF0276 family)